MSSPIVHTTIEFIGNRKNSFFPQISQMLADFSLEKFKFVDDFQSYPMDGSVF